MKTLKRTAALESADMETKRTEGFDGPNDDLTLELIRDAALAGAYRIAAREAVQGRGGFLKLANHRSGLAGLLCDELAFRACMALQAAEDDLDSAWD